MIIPKPTYSAGIINFNFTSEQLNIKCTRLRQHSDGRVTGEIIITTTAPGVAPHLKQSIFNFAAERSRKELANSLAQSFNGPPWGEILEGVSVKVLQHIRQGEPVEDLDPDEDIKPPEYLLRPLIVEGETNLIYGEGGSGKSTVALLACQIIQSGWWDNPYDLILKRGKAATCLYLDWESYRRNLAWQHKSILMGADRPYFKLKYRRCSLPLADDLEQIQEAIEDAAANLIIIDSAGMAAGGDLNKSETATGFFKGLRKLMPAEKWDSRSLTNLVISHTSKDPLTKRKTPFGSVYFYNESRNIIETVHTKDEDERLQVGLFHRKANNFALAKPLGFEISRLDNMTMIESADVRTIGGFMEHLNISVQICAVLKQGAAGYKEIAKTLDIKPQVIANTLSKMKKKGTVVKIEGDLYGLAAPEETPVR